MIKKKLKKLEYVSKNKSHKYDRMERITSPL